MVIFEVNLTHTYNFAALKKRLKLTEKDELG